MGGNTKTTPYTTQYVLGALSQIERMRESLYYGGDIEGVHVICDIELILKRANLTEKQAEVVDLYYYKQLTQEEVAKVMGTSQQAVLDRLNKVRTKIDRVVKRWRVLDEQYSY